jgi:hypothetical protein
MIPAGIRRLFVSGSIAAGCLALASPAGAQAASAKTSPTFEERVAAYAELHRECVRRVQATGLDAQTGGAKFQQALADAIRAARRGAQPGDVFTPEIAARLTQLVRADIAARQLSDQRAIFEEVPRVLVLHVHDPYPSGEPRATVPPGLLIQMPPLPPELQYRFVDRTLILLDVDANLIVDFLPKALPRRR